MSNFQTILIIVFVALLLLGVLVFAGVLPGFRQTPGGEVGTVTLWGTIPLELMNPLLNEFNSQHQGRLILNYTAKNPNSYEAELLEALAALRGPDLFFFPETWVVRHADKVRPTSYETLPLREIQNRFVDETGLYLKPEGVLALPLYLDPLLLYFNKDLLASAGLVSPATTWTKLKLEVEQLVRFDERRNILQSAIALGQMSNIRAAKDILATLLFQAGNPIVVVTGGAPRVVLDQNFNLAAPPGVRVVDFFNQFSNPSSATYSWNRSLPESLEAFTAGKLVYYFGFASDYERIRRQNPHLNFDVAMMPQKDEGPKITFARMQGVAVSRQTRNPAGGQLALQLLTEADSAGRLAAALRLPPARRDLLSRDNPDPTLAVFYRAAAVSRGWLDPDPAASGKIFRDMIEAASTGRVDTATAVGRATDELTALFAQ